jgi:hypothetical protein
MKQVITDNGEVFYFDFSRDITNWLHINLYIVETAKVKKKRKVGTKGFFKTPVYEEYTENVEKKVKVESVEISLSGDKEIHDYSLDEIKGYVNKCITLYKSNNKNKIDFDEWDGYLGDDDARKKEIMRDQKIKDLLKGDTSKLEKFLDSED